MRLAIVLALVSGSALAQGRVYDRTCEVGSRRSSRGGVSCAAVSYAQFEFAPASGAGMGAACACTTPTAATGETMTFSRASTGWCAKGNETSGIADGDLVECASGQPRVMPGGDGTGGLGLSVWEARTNTTIRSSEFDNVAYGSNNTSGTDPTVTANYANAPDGTLTAERVQISAVGNGQYSQRYQISGCPGSGTFSLSRYFRGTSGSGVAQMYSDGVCVQCAFNATTWTRCELPGIVSVASGAPAVGLVSATGGCAGGALGAVDFLTWGGQCEAGATVGPYIATTAAAATRLAEVASFPLTVAGATRSMAATWVPPSTFTATRTALQIYLDASNSYALSSTTTAATSTVTALFRIGGVDTTRLTTATMTASTSARLAGYYDGTNRAACLDGTCLTTAGALTLPTGASTVYVGGRQAGAGFESNGVVKKVCVDPVATRCL